MEEKRQYCLKHILPWLLVQSLVPSYGVGKCKACRNDREEKEKRREEKRRQEKEKKSEEEYEKRNRPEEHSNRRRIRAEMRGERRVTNRL